MTAATVSAVTDRLAAVAAAGLPTGPASPDAPLGSGEWSMLLSSVRSQRLTGLLAAAIATGAWPVTDEQLEAAADAHVSQCAWVLALERRLVELAAQLEGLGIDFRVLKGSALGHLDYPDPADRCFGDIDLVVPSDAFPEASRLLRDAGGERKFPEPRPGFDVRFSKGASFRMPDGVEVDLHRTLVLGWFGLRLDPDDLFASSEEFVVGGKRLPALGRPERLVHACIHASLGNSHPRWMPVRDVAQLTLASDVGAALGRARAWRCEIVVADAIRHAWTRLGLTLDHDLVRWAVEYPATDADRAHLGAYRGSGRSHARLAMAGVSAVDGWRDRARYLHAVLFPKRATNRLPTATRLRHGVGALKAWRSR